MKNLKISNDWLRWRAKATPHKTALLFGNTVWNFAELDLLTDQMASWLRGLEMPENSRLGVLMQNRPEYVLLIYAANRLGLTLVTFNSRLTAAEVGWQIEFTACELVIADGENYGKVDGLADVRVAQVPEIDQLGGLDQSGEWAAANGVSSGIDMESVQAIVFTSGTTGRPKAVPVTYQQHFFSAMGSSYRLGVETNDIWLSVLPLYHVGGMAVVFRSLLYGTAIDLHRKFDLTEINESLDQKEISMISVVPTMLYRLSETRESWPESLRLILVGGAAASPELVEAAGRLSKNGRPLVATSYGMTEVGSQFATQHPADVVSKPASVGRPFLYNELRIVDAESAEDWPAGEYGEIWIRGPVVMSGYLDNPEANGERFVDGWFCTGDLGYLDEDGDLFVVQRRSDLILSGGENVYPAEVEAALRQHPSVKEACVVGVPNVEWGQVVAAMVELLPDQRLDGAVLDEFIRAELAGYKRPRVYKVVEQLPQTASGKIERKQVAEMMRSYA